ncbi:hypothetical protein RA28_10100 [Ruegeria sp. ANG-S4]|uniref:hypothetical protein n=1 Tax=Ruegeria sp. ANG-S4 TaxID=1577904 RepID=UPI00057C425B|nr:hypothetical protein [Ruegeria sp. ANG-S4]KIC45984.1 hypothetical protein RA28_10100 [Ruegeria sp. ANG-S4]
MDSTKTDVRVGFDFPIDHPRAQFLQAAVSNRDQSPPAVMNPSGVIYPGVETISAVERGKLDFGWINFCHLELLAPELRGLHAPFALKDKQMKTSEQRRDYLNTVNSALAHSPFQIAAVMRGADQVFCFENPLDLRESRFADLRIRVAGAGMYEEVVSALGATPAVASIVSAADLCTANGVDGAFTSPGAWSVLFRKHFRHVYLIENLMMITYVLLMRKEDLSTPWAQPVMQANHELVTENWETMRRQDLEIIDTMCTQTDGSFTCIEATDAELERLNEI